MKTRILTLTAALVWRAVSCIAHPGHEPEPPLLLAAARIGEADHPAKSSSANQIGITTNGAFRLIRANGWPDHAPGKFPNRGNPNSLAAQSYNFRVAIQPQTNSSPRDARGAWFGVALNGVPFEPGTGEFWNGQRQWNYEAKSGFIDLGLDAHNAHVQPNGAYHYHGLPVGLMEKLGGDGIRMLLVGFAADGFPIYTSYGPSVATNAMSPLRKMRSSWKLKPGERAGGPGGTSDGKFTADYEYISGSGDLDECNGRFGATPDYPQGIYHYYLTEDFPYIARQWRGAPDASFMKRDGPGGGQRGPGGREPREGRPLREPRVPGAPPPPRL